MAKTVLITGSSDRIGRAFALALSKRGYHCYVHYNTSEENARETQKLIGETGGKVSLVQADFSDVEQVEGIIGEISREEPLDLLINCASSFVESSIYDEGYALFDELMTINFKAPYILTKEYAAMHERGHIVNILDTKVSQNHTKHLDYLLTKKLLRDFTLLSATQLGPGIRVNGISPGIILPPPGKGEAYTDKLAEGIPLERSGNPEELVKALEFFMSSDFVTGQVIYVDGGEHL